MFNVARSLIFVGLTTAVLLGCVPRASADLNLTYGQNSTLLGNGPHPNVAGDYATVNFVRNSATQVTMTINVTNVIPNAFIDQIGFNFNHALAATTPISYSSGVSASNNYSGGNLVGSSNTFFSTLFNYPSGPQSARLNFANGPSVYTITFANGTSLNNDLSNLLALSSTRPESAIHLAGYTAANGGTSSSLVNQGSGFTPQNELPEPSALALGLMGSVFVCALNGCRRLRAKLAGNTSV